MKTLKRNSKGEEVLQLQKNLIQLGYQLLDDGVFGFDTERIVKQFQSDNGLSADGIAGINTITVINDLLLSSAIYGIDISHHNGLINWNKVPFDQIKFVYCKATQGKSFKDQLFPAYFNELKRLRVMRGGYHFFTFMGVTAKEQADNFLSTTIDWKDEMILPPVLDVEWQQSPGLNQYILDNRKSCVKKISDWLSIVEEKCRRKPVIYTNAFFWKDYLNDPAGFEEYLLWTASYRKDYPLLPKGWNKYTFWQFTESASISGITGNVDKNIFNGKLSDLKKLCKPV